MASSWRLVTPVPPPPPVRQHKSEVVIHGLVFQVAGASQGGGDSESERIKEEVMEEALPQVEGMDEEEAEEEALEEEEALDDDDDDEAPMVETQFKVQLTWMKYQLYMSHMELHQVDGDEAFVLWKQAQEFPHRVRSRADGIMECLLYTCVEI